MAELLQEYELSIWEEISTPNSEGLGQFTEQKIAVIGSNNLHTPTKAYGVSLKENINGEKTLTFSLPRAYRDKNGELLDNPFLSFLTAERKLKLRDGPEYNFLVNETFDPNILLEEDTEERWIDFVIKNVEEDKETYVNTYTCKEVYVNELGKNGWNIVLDSELENNYGTLTELATKVLDGSGWKVGESYSPMERISEPLFYATTNNIQATNVVSKEQTEIAGIIYVFYSELEFKNNWQVKENLTKCQIMYNNGKTFGNNILDDNREVIDDKDEFNYWVDSADLANLVFMPTGGSPEEPTAIQGGRIIESVQSHFEAVADQYVEDCFVKTEYLTEVGLPSEYYLNEDNQVENNLLVYHYTENKVLTSEMINNYIVNASGFTAKTGWSDYTGNENNILLRTWAYDSSVDQTGKNYVTSTETTDTWTADLNNYILIPRFKSSTDTDAKSLCNNGINYNGYMPKPGQKMIARIKARIMDKTTGLTFLPTANQYGSFKVRIGYKDGNVIKDIGNSNIISQKLFNFNTTGKDIGYPIANNRGGFEKDAYVDDQGYYCVGITIKSDLFDSYGKTIMFALDCQNGWPYDNDPTGDWYWHVEDVQFFDYIEDENKNFIRPGDVPTAKFVPVDHYYIIIDSTEGKRVHELVPNTNYYTPIIRANNESIRHTDVKESNYFNNINNLAELFEVWAKFKVYHTKDGRVLLQDGKPKKEVIFTRFATESNEMNWAGFRYGINLKSIKRTIETNAIASKVIVKDNNNEFATDGMASIRRAVDNPTGDNIVYNFDYYIAHGLLDQATVLNDLYGTTTSHFGYFRKLKYLNNLILPINEKLSKYEGALRNAQQLLDYTQVSIDACDEQLAQQTTYYNQIKSIYGAEHSKTKNQAEAIAQIKAQLQSYKNDLQNYDNQINKYNQLINGTLWTKGNDYAKNEIVRYIANSSDNTGIVQYHIKWYKALEDIKESNHLPCNSSSWEEIILDGSQDIEDEVLEKLPIAICADYYKAKKQELDAQFYNKYYRFIQEATWTDEKYIDDNLYYYDAVKVSAQNAWPKTQYNIGIIDIDNIPEYAAYKFKIGQRSYIEDTEFFGYEMITVNDSSFLTPKKKEVIVNERTRNFDDPSKSTITIKTYKNQFEELFSKLSATTTSLQYASGQYQKAANVVESDGSIAIESLEQAFAKNSFILANASNQLVTWDSGTGIEVADAKNPLEIVRITSKGIMMTEDAGDTWTLGITAKGINTALLTAGTITADKIRIMSSDKTALAFNWGSEGITANKQSSNSGGNSYVRFNEYGIFGTNRGIELDNEINKAQDFDQVLDLIRQYSNFSLSWDGLLLNYQDGATSVSADNGVEIFHKGENDSWIFSEEYINKYNPLQPNGEAYLVNDPIPIVSLGKYRTSEKESLTNNEIIGYGLRLRNKQGYITLETEEENGNLWLRESLNLGVALDGTRKAITGISGKYEVVTDDNNEIIGYSGNAFWAGWLPGNDKPKFYVTHDGLLDVQDAIIHGQVEATSGTFSGIINAESGHISGAINVGDMDNIILSDESYSFEYTDYISGINNTPSTATSTDGTVIANSNKENYLFWGGVELIELEDSYMIAPKFYVDQNGKLYAKDAEITGTINATSGSFSGDITANSGLLKYLELDNSRGFIGLNPSADNRQTITNTNDDVLLNINNTYLVDSTGNIYGDKLYLSRAGADFLNPSSYNISIGGENILNVKDALVIDNLGNINMSGSLNATNLTLNGELNTEGRIKVGNILISGQNGSISSGESWSINGNGTAFFNDVTVRGKITSSVFERQHITSVGGVLELAPSLYLEQDYKAQLSIVNGVTAYWFLVPATFEWSGTIKVALLTGETSAINEERESFYNENELLLIKAENENEVLPRATIIRRIDMESCLIRLSAQDINGPTIKMLHKKEDKESTVILGSLEDISKTTAFQSNFPVNNPGYGLYADNAYITGQIVLPRAGIINLTTPDFNEMNWLGIDNNAPANNNIRFWAGADYINRNTAPFIVTEDGSVYAAKGVFKGQVVAENSIFSGSIEASHILLSENDDSDLGPEYQDFDIRYYDDQIVRFNRNGQKIYKNLEIYADNDTSHTHPIFSKMVSDNKNYFNIANLQVWDCRNSNELEKEQSHISIKDGKIGFRRDILDSTSTSSHESNSAALWSKVDSNILGLFETNKFGMQSNQIYLSSLNRDIIVIEDQNNDPITTIYGKHRYGNIMEINTVSDGIIFNFIGEENENTGGS